MISREHMAILAGTAFVVGLFLLIVWSLNHLHEPCSTFNLTEDFWGNCIR